MDSLHTKPEQETVVFNTLASLKHKKTVGPIERAMLNTIPPKAEPKQALDKFFEVENELGLHYDEKPKQEPVAYINVEQHKLEWAKYMSWYTPTVVNLPKIPLYTTPPQRTWVGLTDAEINNHYQNQEWLDGVIFAENLLKEKNN